ncbi:MAG: hypothetical protein ABJO36_00220 [Litorimonas sp.]
MKSRFGIIGSIAAILAVLSIALSLWIYVDLWLSDPHASGTIAQTITLFIGTGLFFSIAGFFLGILGFFETRPYRSKAAIFSLVTSLTSLVALSIAYLLF